MRAACFFFTDVFLPSNKHTFRSAKYYVVVVFPRLRLDGFVTHSGCVIHKTRRVGEKESQACANRDFHLVIANLFYLSLPEHSAQQPVVYLPWKYKRCILCKVCLHISTCDQAVN